MVDEAMYVHLACHADGRTYVVPISFARIADQIYGITTEGLKIDMMRKHPDVCVQVESIRSLTDWRTAILWGKFKELEGSERSAAAGLLVDRYGTEFYDQSLSSRFAASVTPPRLDGQHKHFIVYAISVSEMSGRTESLGTLVSPARETSLQENP